MWLNCWQPRPTDGSIDDGHHLFDVVQEQAVEENFIGVLKLAKIDITLQVVRLERESFIGADALFVERLDDGRQKAVEPKGFALVFREGRAFVQDRIVEQVHTAKADGTGCVSLDDLVMCLSGRFQLKATIAGLYHKQSAKCAT